VEETLEGTVGLGRLATLALLVTKSLLGVCGGVWVQAEHDLLVAQWVLLLHDAALADGAALGWAEHALHLGAVDELGDVGLGDDVGWEEEVTLERGWLGGGAVDLVESGEGRRGPDDEAAEVATWGELEEVQGKDG